MISTSSRKHVIARWMCALIAVIALEGTGCSWVFVEGPPATAAQPQLGAPGMSVQASPWLTCTTSRAWPIIDAVLATAFATTGGVFVWSGISSGDATLPFGVVAIGYASVHAFAALSGYRKTTRCREAHAAHAAR